MRTVSLSSSSPSPRSVVSAALSRLLAYAGFSPSRSRSRRLPPARAGAGSARPQVESLEGRDCPSGLHFEPPPYLPGGTDTATLKMWKVPGFFARAFNRANFEAMFPQRELLPPPHEGRSPTVADPLTDGPFVPYRIRLALPELLPLPTVVPPAAIPPGV